MKGKKKIAIVDDDPSIVDVLTLILEDAGYEVISTTESSNVSRLIKTDPSLLLLDIWMPGLNGKEICKNLKSEASTKKLPIIFISASRDTRDIATESGADGYICKPFEMDDLLIKIAMYIAP